MKFKVCEAAVGIPCFPFHSTSGVPLGCAWQCALWSGVFRSALSSSYCHTHCFYLSPLRKFIQRKLNLTLVGFSICLSLHIFVLDPLLKMLFFLNLPWFTWLHWDCPRCRMNLFGYSVHILCHLCAVRTFFYQCGCSYLFPKCICLEWY